MRVGIVLLLGPGEREISRTIDLLKSLIRHEERHANQIGLCVINDGNRRIDLLRPFLANLPLSVVIPNPIAGAMTVCDRQCAGVLEAFRYFNERSSDLAFVLKVDTDSLFIGPFVEALDGFFAANQRVGSVGSYFHEPDGVSRLSDLEDDWGPRMRHVHRKSLLRTLLVGLFRRDSRALSRHLRRREAFELALANGYRYGHHVQGGGVAYSGQLLRASTFRPFSSDPLLFAGSYLGDDSVTSMLVMAAGFELRDLNGDNEPFGVWFSKPRWTAEELLESGRSILHSIKDSNINVERELRTRLLGIPSAVGSAIAGEVETR